MYNFQHDLFLYQVIVCTKEVSAGARKNAYNLLVEIGKTFVRFCGNTKGNTVSLCVCALKISDAQTNIEILI